jgi:hypothetical protein
MGGDEGKTPDHLNINMTCRTRDARAAVTTVVQDSVEALSRCVSGV